MGYGELMVFDLQFTDDTIISCESDVEQILNVKKVLHCFQVMSGLNINFHKSCLFGINVVQHNLVEWANKICCKVDVFLPFIWGCHLGPKQIQLKCGNR